MCLDLLIVLRNDRDPLRRLHEEDRPVALVDVVDRNAAGPAALARVNGKSFRPAPRR